MLDTAILLSRDHARAAWAASGLRLEDLELASIRRLSRLIDRKMRAAELMSGSLRMAPFLLRKWPRPQVELRCSAYYFNRREAVTFYSDGFVGFAGWADGVNSVPVLQGFMEWLDTEKKVRQT